MEFILILICAFCVIALIYVINKGVELDRESDIVAEVMKKAATKEVVIKKVEKVEKKETEKKEEGKPSGPPQTTILEFSPKTGVRLCRFCDGENVIGAKVCAICGQDI